MSLTSGNGTVEFVRRIIGACPGVAPSGCASMERPVVSGRPAEPRVDGAAGTALDEKGSPTS